jgi:hypothetical protein
LGDPVKSRDVLNYLKKRRNTQYIYCKIHILLNDGRLILVHLGVTNVSFILHSDSSGVAIVLNNNFQFAIHRLKVDVNGNKIDLDISIQNYRYRLLNIYCPNVVTPNFYTEVRQDIEDLKISI